MENHQELIDIITGWIHAQESDQEVVRILQEARVPVAPILTPVEAMDHPQLRQRGTVQTVTDRALGEFIIPGMSFRFSKFPPLDLQAPFLGEHNAQVLTELGGLTPEQVAEMEADGALVSEPVPDGQAAT